MADAALFIGYGLPVRGREAKAVAVFGEAIGYWSGLQQQGKIESFEVGLAAPTGGDLGGFTLLRGSPEQLSELQVTPEFQRMTIRAQLIVENLRIVQVALGQLLADQMTMYQQQLPDLA